MHYAEFSANGFFVPLYAIKDNSVYVVQDGIATPRNIQIARQDSEMAYVSSGLKAGDLVILSTVNSGDKVSVQNDLMGV